MLMTIARKLCAYSEFYKEYIIINNFKSINLLKNIIKYTKFPRFNDIY